MSQAHKYEIMFFQFNQNLALLINWGTFDSTALTKASHFTGTTPTWIAAFYFTNLRKYWISLPLLHGQFWFHLWLFSYDQPCLCQDLEDDVFWGFPMPQEQNLMPLLLESCHEGWSIPEAFKEIHVHTNAMGLFWKLLQVPVVILHVLIIVFPLIIYLAVILILAPKKVRAMVFVPMLLMYLVTQNQIKSILPCSISCRLE